MVYDPRKRSLTPFFAPGRRQLLHLKSATGSCTPLWISVIRLTARRRMICRHQAAAPKKQKTRTITSANPRVSGPPVRGTDPRSVEGKGSDAKRTGRAQRRNSVPVADAIGAATKGKLRRRKRTRVCPTWRPNIAPNEHSESTLPLFLGTGAAATGVLGAPILVVALFRMSAAPSVVVAPPGGLRGTCHTARSVKQHRANSKYRD
jgi:hypothetical protein